MARYSGHGRPLTAQLDFSSFSRVTREDLDYPRVVDGGESFLGNELDLTLGLEPLPQLFVSAGVGLLSQGAAFGARQPNAYLAFLSAHFQL